jgi:hypothetical protein
MLTSYLLKTRQLLQVPDAPVTLYPDTDLISFLNEARKQTAGEGDCIRVLGTLNTTIGQRNYDFTSINTGTSSANGVQGPLRLEQMLYAVGDGFLWFRSRPWPWFMSFKLSNPVPTPGVPQVWSQYGQGSTGSFYLDPPPDFVYALTIDCVCLPIDLVDDTTVEAIPPLWQTAVPFYAAYLALLSAQSAQRQGDADRMIARYTEYVDRARKFSTPSANRYFYPQREDLTQLNKLGISPKGAA